MNKIIIFFLFLLNFSDLLSQTSNLVRNNSFESYDLYWKVKDNVTCFSTNYTFEYRNWFDDLYNSNIVTLSAGVPDNFFGSQLPIDGSRYVGIWCERHRYGPHSLSFSGMTYGSIGIELSSPLQKDVEYLIRFKISKMDKSTKDANYQVDVAKSINSNNSCPFFGSDEVKNAVISNTSSWDEVNITYKPTENGYKYLFFSADNWFLIRTNNLAGFYLDDVMVVEKCRYQFPCSRTYTPLNPVFGNVPHSENNPFFITNIENATHLTNFKIKLGGQTIRYIDDVYSINGISNKIYWDGKRNDGTEVAPSYYIMYYKISNDCFSESKSFTISKQNSASTPTNCPNCLYPPYNNSVRIPSECCPDMPNFSISNQTISGQGEIHYIAQNTITTQGNVIVTSDVDDLLFQAGQQIILNPGFQTQSGANAVFKIQSCSPQNLFKPIIYANNNYNYDTILTDSNFSFYENQQIIFDIFPNPNNGLFNLIFKKNNVSYSYEILNFFGQLIITGKSSNTEIQFDLSNYPKGIYFLRIYSINTHACKTIIYQ